MEPQRGRCNSPGHRPGNDSMEQTSPNGAKSCRGDLSLAGYTAIFRPVGALFYWRAIVTQGGALGYCMTPLWGFSSQKSRNAATQRATNRTPGEPRSRRFCLVFDRKVKSDVILSTTSQIGPRNTEFLSCQSLSPETPLSRFLGVERMYRPHRSPQPVSCVRLL